MFDNEYFQDESDFTQSCMEPILDQSFSKTKLHLEEFFDFNEDFDQEDFLKNTKEIEQLIIVIKILI